jgi:hypothetical protein
MYHALHVSNDIRRLYQILALRGTPTIVYLLLFVNVNEYMVKVAKRFDPLTRL